MQLRLGRRPPSEYELAREQRRAGPPTVVSVVLHILLVFVVASAVTSSTVLERFFFTDETPSTPHEKVQFLAVPPGVPGASTAPSTPTRTAPAPRAEQPVPALVAPREIPSGVPAPSTGNPAASKTNPGPLAGGSGSARGAQPGYVDPRLWVPDPALIYAPKTDKERLDSALVTSFKRYQDSVAANTYSPNKFERGDWTVERDGKKYGIDSKFIHLGSFSIPTALLAMLPLNMGQANPTDVDRARAASFMRNDILYHAQAAVNEEEFRKAVKAIRDRKDREHRQEQEKVIARKGDPHTIIAPGDRPPQ